MGGWWGKRGTERRETVAPEPRGRDATFPSCRWVSVRSTLLAHTVSFCLARAHVVRAFWTEEDGRWKEQQLTSAVDRQSFLLTAAGLLFSFCRALRRLRPLLFPTYGQMCASAALMRHFERVDSMNRIFQWNCASLVGRGSAPSTLKAEVKSFMKINYTCLADTPYILCICTSKTSTPN